MNKHKEIAIRDKAAGKPKPQDEMDEWELYEEDGPMDLEDQLEACFERAKESKP